MDLTRRKFLQATGVTASTIAASGTGGAASVATAREGALVAGNGPYLVVGESGVTELCHNYHDAVRQASLLRHSTGGPAQHVRCSRSLMRQLSTDMSTHWIEVDGLAVTPGEVETRAFEFLRRARNPEDTRRRIWSHHLATLREGIDQDDLSAPDTHWYACADGVVHAVAAQREDIEDNDDTQSVHACSAELARALETHLETGDPCPEISVKPARHVTEEEYQARLVEDLPFRVAFTEPEERRVPIARTAKRDPVSVSILRSGHWLFRMSDATDLNLDEVTTLQVSPHLHDVLQSDGFAMPGFWRSVDGVLHHLDDFADNVPEPTLLGRSVRHQNRHT